MAKAFKEVNDPMMVIVIGSGVSNVIEWGDDAITVDMTEVGADKRIILVNLLQLTDQEQKGWKELEEKGRV